MNHNRQKTSNTRSELSFKNPSICHVETPLSGSNSSNGALLFQQGYMRKKDIKDILKDEE